MYYSFLDPEYPSAYQSFVSLEMVGGKWIQRKKNASLGWLVSSLIFGGIGAVIGGAIGARIGEVALSILMGCAIGFLVSTFLILLCLGATH